jgi:hypothetical protein
MLAKPRKAIRVQTEITHQRSERIVTRVHGPDDFIERGHQFARLGADVLEILFAFETGSGHGLGAGGQHAHFRDARAQFIVQVLGDAGAFRFHGALVFDALAFPNLRAEFNRAFLHLPVELRDPQSGRRQHTGQHPNDHEQTF